jgi:hypothetical protein
LLFDTDNLDNGLEQGQPRFASLATVLINPDDRGTAKRHKAQQQLCHILAQFRQPRRGNPERDRAMVCGSSWRRA